MGLEIIIYGADQLCASCVNAPGSKETFEWIQAAVTRKFGEEGILYKYVDINNPPQQAPYNEMAERVVDEEFFYPLIVINDQVVGEGNPRLKTIFKELENNGLEPIE